mmetsp:Transcript_11009/g.27022  ORF Transcript_11009/g.27022 Transcript_11009/m.27022 type:complete len:1420 (+) Transcript_11009:152-4411(+)
MGDKEGLREQLFRALTSLSYKSLFVEELKSAFDKDEKVYKWSNPGWGSTTKKAAVSQVGFKFSKKELPDELKYTLIPRTFLGKATGITGAGAKGSDREAVLAFRYHENEPTRAEAITAIGFYEPSSEALPYGFEAVPKGVSGDKYDAEIHVDEGKKSVLLMVDRTRNGTFINQVGLTLEEDIPVLQQGAFCVNRTPSGIRSSLGKSTFLCYNQDFSAVSSSFESMKELKGAKVGMAVAACIMSGEEGVITGCMNFIAEMNVGSVHEDVFNKIIELLCQQGLPIVFGSDSPAELMRLLGYIFEKHSSSMSVTSVMQVLILCVKLHSMPEAQKLQEYLTARVISSFGPAPPEKKTGPLKDFLLEPKADMKQADRRHANTTTVLEGQGFANPDAKGALPDSPNISEADLQIDANGHVVRGEDSKDVDDKKEISQMCKELVMLVVQRIEREKPPPPCFEGENSWAVHIRGFFKDPYPTPEFFTSAMHATKTISKPEERILVGHVLALCKIATEPNRSQHALRRRITCLRQLRDILGASASVWGESEALSAILKRFVSLTLAKSAAVDAHRSYNTGHPSLLKEVLKCLILITHKFKLFLSPQLGALIGELVLPLLTGPHVSLSHKEDILSMLTRMMSTHQAVVNVYYNYDNHAKGRRLFQQIVEAAAKIAEGDMDGKGKSKATNNEQMNVQISALKFLVKILEVLAARCEEFKERLANGPGAIAPALIQQARMAKARMTSKAAQGQPDTKSRLHRRSTWSARQIMQAEDDEIIDSAIRKFKSVGAKKCQKYLGACKASLATPSGFAGFLWENQDKLDQKEIGDYIGSTGKAPEQIKFFEDLRRHHFKKSNFCGISLVGAVRTLLENGGFYLPGEGQKIGVIITSFAEAYHAQNPGSFAQQDDVEVLAYQIVMLNTDLHRPLKKKTDRRMSLDELCRNLRGMCDRENGKGKDFDRSLLESIYNEVKTKPFKKFTTSNVKEKSEQGPSDGKNARQEYFQMLMRKAEGELEKAALIFQTYRSSKSPTIAKGLFDVCWWMISSATDLLLKQVESVEVAHLCIECVRHGARIGIRLQQETERKAFLRILAEKHFIEIERAKEKEEAQSKRRKGKTLEMKLANNEHERTLWYRRLNMHVKRNCQEKALKILDDVVEETKGRVSHDKQQEILQELQAGFNNEIILIEPMRKFLFQDTLTKISDRNSKSEEYDFFLFSDILVYAKAKGKGQFAVHQVLHLSLARIVDIEKPHTFKGLTYNFIFKVKSPQKIFLIACANAAQKSKWVTGIVKAIEAVMKRRQQYLTLQQEQMSIEDGKVSDLESSNSLAVMSSWIATSEMDLFGKGDTRQVQGCKLCIRPFSKLYRRKHQCHYCRDNVCGDCRSKRTNINPKKKTYVCDACYGFLNGLVSGTYMTGGKTVSIPILSADDQANA